MAGKVMEHCPKCARKITNETECENCGIVFEKYLQAEARRKAAAEQVLAEQVVVAASGSGNRRIITVSLALIAVSLVLIAIAGVLMNSVGRPHGASALKKGNPPALAQKDQHENAKSFLSSSARQTETPDKKLSEEEPIQRALGATVSVKTPWGSMGSGFFISEHAVITNKHVVVFDDTSYETFKTKVERNRKIIDLELEKIKEAKRRMQQLPAGPSRTQWELIIQDKEEDVNKALPIQREEEEKLATIKEQMSSRDIRIITADNKEYTVDRIETSATHDLALLRVDSVSGQVLKRNPQEHRLEQGQVIYAIGSPLGLSNTVTSGIFSAYRKMGNSEETYLQIDAAINPGNSGGPLIDKQGYVLGVNTLGTTQAEGIGFAIPIEVVFTEFSDGL